MQLADIETKHLAAFLAIYEHRSFGKAATALGFSQAAVSQQVANLERAVGGSLFDRPGGPRPVVPTEAGREFLPYAQAIFRHLNEGYRAITEVQEGRRGRLSISSFESASVALLPRIVTEFTQAHPGVRLDLVEDGDCDHATERVISGEIDLAIETSLIEHPDIESRVIMVDPFVAVRPSSEGEASMALSDLATSRLVGHRDEDLCQRTVNEALAAWGTTPNYVFRSADNSAVRAMVRAGVGIAVMPWLSIGSDSSGLSLSPIDPPIEPRIISVAWRAGRQDSPAFATFVDIAEATASDIVATRPSDLHPTLGDAERSVR